MTVGRCVTGGTVEAHSPTPKFSSDPPGCRPRMSQPATLVQPPRPTDSGLVHIFFFPARRIARILCVTRDAARDAVLPAARLSTTFRLEAGSSLRQPQSRGPPWGLKHKGYSRTHVRPGTVIVAPCPNPRPATCCLPTRGFSWASTLHRPASHPWAY